MTTAETHHHHPTVLVIGASGTTGSRVVAQLAALGCEVRAASRRAAPREAARRATPQGGIRPARFDWYDPATYAEALRGADALYLVPPIGDPDPAAVMLPFLDRARTAGVRRVALLSSSAIPRGGPAVGRVHDALPGLFDEWAVLRPSWFMQNFTGDHLHARSIRTGGVIATATGDGRVGFVDADDIAAVAARALTDRTAPNTDLVLTGPEALSYDAVAAIITQVTGRPVTHRRLSVQQVRDHLAADVPADFAALLADLDRSIAEGAEDRTTDTVERMTGRPPRRFARFAEVELAKAAELKTR
ncbi:MULTISPECIES: NmrA family NAD(P)-binding protein [Streptomyces]|uniref:NAD(P)H-binding protein n=2 Tax=Streptomyces rimosus subsp. rimosus TaxID=132474 RepID=L8ESP4_STRR1|nr:MULTISPECIES: NmrA family NAD(P)-binding protein [Streptomyces]KOG80028.1 oxidoreductase [Kitasatospora aureofaciens]MYT44188.1 NAD(P)H-binding protein [Streptomyces sp. SID5471]KEF08297.1 oxidoreductase [Streptomyces rimosus]KOT31024.1 oxidoreductase [Streptomyces rimosus subsp. rimosus]KOT31074.1 oxidoreductase [Streptomyces sp. NRRL WC-3701]